MEPRIIEKGQRLFAGFSFFGDPFRDNGGWDEENEIGRLWQRWFQYLHNHPQLMLQAKEAVVYHEIHIMNEETIQRGVFEVFVGMEIEQVEGLPAEVLVKVLPATKYAVFTIEGQQITGDWPQQIYSVWLPKSGYQDAYPFHIQQYDQRFKGMERIEDSVIDVYVPIQAKP